jgi:23S rRNA pseudouridine2605 synthase
MPESRTAPSGGDRLAKVMARSGLCSRRDAEEWIKSGRVSVNGKIVKTPAFNVTDSDNVVVDGAPLAARQGTRVWLYHKPAGLMVTEKDPEGRPTVFEKLSELGLPRVVSIGRLDFNTEGLLLVTNDGGLKRVLELPATGWLRKYRVRAHGTITQAQLDTLKKGVEVEGVKYGSIEAVLEREQGANVWLQLSLREGKNREVKNVLFSLGLEVNRLIRISYGPFQLGDIPVGGIETVKAKVLKEQLGKRLADEAEVDFESELPERDMSGQSGERQFGRGTNTAVIAQQRFRFTDRPDRAPGEVRDNEPPPRHSHRPGGRDAGRPERPRTPVRKPREEDAGPPRQIHFDDGREPTVFEPKSYGKSRPPRTDGDDERPRAPRRAADAGDRPVRDRALKPGARPGADRPKRDFGDRSARPAGDRPRSSRPTGDTDRPKRSFGDKPRSPRPARSFDKPRAPRADGDTPRPSRSFADKPRSPRPAGDRPYSARPPRPDADRPRSPRAPRADGDAARPSRPYSAKPRSPRPAGAESRPARTPGNKPRSPRPSGDRTRPPRDGAPRGPRKPRS